MACHHIFNSSLIIQLLTKHEFFYNSRFEPSGLALQIQIETELSRWVNSRLGNNIPARLMPFFIWRGQQNINTAVCNISVILFLCNLDLFLLDAKLFIDLGIFGISHSQMRFFEGDLDVWIRPNLLFIKSLDCSQLKCVLITNIVTVCTISQLTFKKLIVSIKLSLYSEVRSNVSHFTKRLGIDALITSVKVLHCDVD